MSVLLIGQEGGPPFNRTFFNVTLVELLERSGTKESLRLTLFLTDGATLDLCKIEEMKEQYLVLRGYKGDEDLCDLTLHLVPYGLIYRLELAPKESDDRRVGFHWTPPPETSAQPPLKITATEPAKLRKR